MVEVHYKIKHSTLQKAILADIYGNGRYIRLVVNGAGLNYTPGSVDELFADARNALISEFSSRGIALVEHSIVTTCLTAKSQTFENEMAQGTLKTQAIVHEAMRAIGARNCPQVAPGL